jgi:hypothetical protein
MGIKQQYLTGPIHVASDNGRSALLLGKSTPRPTAWVRSHDKNRAANGSNASSALSLSTFLSATLPKERLQEH